ncbi:MAG: virulence protein [Candidatus Kapabacteria bacterium]|nr:virulence protein [Candidatus Kapabacteria bacterium]
MKNEIILYRPNNLVEHIEVRIDEDIVWLNQDQLVNLFQRDQSVISRHINNIFKDGELDKKGNMQKVHIPNSDKLVTFFNLDVIISVGYNFSIIK